MGNFVSNTKKIKNLPGSIIYFLLKKNSEEIQTCIVMKAKILIVMDEYLRSNPLFCRMAKWQFSPEIQRQIRRG